jgi:hypothetical protein
MCKFLTYLSKYLKIEDLDEIEKILKDIFVENVLANCLDGTKSVQLIDTKLSRQMKIYFNNYIYDILKDNENYKQEGLS